MFLSEQAELEQVLNEQEELERTEAEKTEALMLAEKKAKELEDQKQASEQVEKIQQETAEAADIHVPSTVSEACSNDASRLDAVEQKLEKFSEQQDDMKRQLLSHGDMLKLILQKLP